MREVSEDDKVEAEKHFEAGVALYERGALGMAISAYEKAVALNPRYTHAYVNKGNALRKLGWFAFALKDYNTAIEVDPEYAPAYNSRYVN